MAPGQAMFWWRADGSTGQRDVGWWSFTSPNLARPRDAQQCTVFALVYTHPWTCKRPASELYNVGPYCGSGFIQYTTPIEQ